jgi:2-oxoglutarate ferredoxin oxidoreductase subunit beta
MLPLELYKEQIEIAWCPGCGNFGMLKAFKQALAELEIRPEQLLVVSGIGQSGKFPHYLQCNTFNGIHGRTLPVATAARLANHELQVVAEAGDGDCYGEGGNHLLATLRRNPNLTLVVHNNQVYALTKGQASPTSDEGYKTLLQPEGVYLPPLHALAIAVAQDCSWVGRGFAGKVEHLTGLYKQALTHKGLALLEVLQPCVTFNRVNTFKWYAERVYEVEKEPDYDPENDLWAYQKAKEWGVRIPIGVIYRHPRPILEELHPVLKEGPLVRQKPERPIGGLLADFY